MLFLYIARTPYSRKDSKTSGDKLSDTSSKSAMHSKVQTQLPGFNYRLAAHAFDNSIPWDDLKFLFARRI